MYIFELVYKIVKKMKEIKNPRKIKENNEEEICEHVYLPVDSTKKVLACTKCGKLVKTEDILENKK